MKWVFAAALPASYFALRYKLATPQNRKLVIRQYRTLSRSGISAVTVPVITHK